MIGARRADGCALLGAEGGDRVRAGGRGDGWGRTVDEPDPGPVVARLAPVGQLEPNGSGQVRMLADGRMVDPNRRRRAPPPTAGTWRPGCSTRRPPGLIALGGLTRDGDGYRGTSTVPGDLPLSDYPAVDVSVESWDGDPGHSGRNVLRGELS